MIYSQKGYWYELTNSFLEDGFDASKFADNLIKIDNGLWISSGHKDFEFLSDDETNWQDIEPRSFWYQHRNNLFLALLRYWQPKGILFEIGAGSGSITKVLQDAGIPIVAIEPTQHLAQQAVKRGIQYMIYSNLENARFQPGSLENVCMFDVMEHISDDEVYLSNIRRLMPEGGRLYIAVPAWHFLWSREDEMADHVRRYNRAELIHKVISAGFEVEFDSYYFFALVLPILFLRAIPSMLGIRKDRNNSSSEREHVLKPGIVAKILDTTFRWEQNRIKRAVPIPFGASCLIVARAAKIS